MMKWADEGEKQMLWRNQQLKKLDQLREELDNIGSDDSDFENFEETQKKILSAVQNIEK